MQPQALASGLSAAYPTATSTVTMSGTRSQRDSDAPEAIAVAADSRLQIPDRRLQTPCPKRVFTKCVTCDYQTRYSYFYSCTLYCRSTADLTLQISTHRWTPSTSTLKSLSSHRPGGRLWTDRLEAATVDLRFFVCRFVSRWLMYAQIGRQLIYMRWTNFIKK